jgi:hypothetical protein
MFLSKLFNRSRAKPAGPLERALLELSGGGLRPRFELRAVKPNETRPGLAGRRLGTFETFDEAFAAFKATKARPGHRLEVSMALLLATRWSPNTPSMPSVEQVYENAQASLTARAADVQLQNYRAAADDENAKTHLNSTGALNGAMESGDDVAALAGLQPRNEPHEDGHLCDSDGKLVDVGRGEFVRTCSVCGVER